MSVLGFPYRHCARRAVWGQVQAACHILGKVHRAAHFDGGDGGGGGHGDGGGGGVSTEPGFKQSRQLMVLSFC